MSCVLLSVLILFLTPVCDYLDARHMKTVDAASIVAGVTAASVLKLTAAAFGVVIATAATAKAVDSFQQWLNENGSEESLATWNQAQAEARELALSTGFIGDVKRWLQSRFSSLDSGEVESVMVGTGEITNGLVTEASVAEAAFRSSVLSGIDGPYLYYISTAKTVETHVYLFDPDDFPSRGLSNPVLLFTSSRCWLGNLNEADVLTITASNGGRDYLYSYANLSGVLSSSTKNYTWPAFDGLGGSGGGVCRIVTNMPVILGDTKAFSGGYSAFLSDVLKTATATYNLDASEHLGTSFGSFSDANASALAGMNLTAADIAKLQGMIDQAVADNTETGDDGKPVYTPDIAQAIIDAYRQGLEDAGNGSGTEDPDTPVNPPVVTPDTGILDFLGGLKDSLQSWITAIPDAVASGAGTIKGTLEAGWSTLWGHLTGIKDTVTEIGDTVTAGFDSVVSGVAALPDVIIGAFSDLHQWILDIPGSFSGAFADLHEWIMDIPETLEAGGAAITDKLDAVSGTLTGALSDLADAIPGADAITTPITDAIADALTVDAAAVAATVEAEKADLWSFPFLSQAQELFDGLSFSEEISYPKIKVETPAVLRPYYDQPEIVLLDFETYKDYCLWARLLFRAAIWLALVWHVVDLITPKLRIS